MLSFREKLAQGIFESQPKVADIPRKSAFLGTITNEGFCDYEVPEDVWYLTKSTERSNRLHKSTIARKHRKEVKRIRFGSE
ncbi:hypothetical protein BZF66_06815 [Salmonella enterica]|nr:hypothetical protein [Salmonella enterica]ECC6867465.1 hypothetical protein [Salmonella enterica]EHX8550461.1 hypothetical protein [Salmonella enterica]ELL7856603.1 hypothetical protein [Salmonella enterica]MCP0435754.1 hypothetical protein [Salmonella enterica subsp. enterica serovar Mbandaka]